MNIVINKDAFTFPIYKSIANQIADQIVNKTLKAGEKLPTERELSSETGISRGTIKNALAELQKRGLIITIQGSGSFVKNSTSSGLDVEQILSTFFDDMRALGFSLQEIETRFTTKLVQLYDKVRKVRVAWVDSCQELINAGMADMAQMKCITTDTYLLSEVRNYPSKVEGYDMVVIGWKDYDSSFAKYPYDPEKLEKVTLNMKISSVISLAKLEKGTSAVIWCSSDIFASMIEKVVADFGTIELEQSIVGTPASELFAASIFPCEVLLAPPEMVRNCSESYSVALSDFKKSGGVIIPIEYQLDRGSFVHLEDKVRELFYKYNEEVGIG